MTNLDPKIKAGWLRALLLFIASFISSQIFAGIGVAIMLVAGGLSMTDMANQDLINDQLQKIGTLLPLKLFEILGMLLPVWLFMKYIDRRPFMSIGLDFKGHKNDFKLGLGLGAGLIATGFAVLSVTGFLTVEGSLAFDLLDSFLYLLLFTIVAFHEEIWVRGYLLNNLMRSTNKYVALSITSLLFMSIHLLNPNISILSVINLFLAGIVLGIYYIHKKNLWLPIGMHLTWNYFQGPVFGFEVSGIETQSIVNQTISGSDLITGGSFGFEGSILATFIIIGMILFLEKKYSN